MYLLPHVRNALIETLVLYIILRLLSKNGTYPESILAAYASPVAKYRRTLNPAQLFSIAPLVFDVM